MGKISSDVNNERERAKESTAIIQRAGHTGGLVTHEGWSHMRVGHT